jgi:hypothetical protein
MVEQQTREDKLRWRENSWDVDVWTIGKQTRWCFKLYDRMLGTWLGLQ